MFLREFGSAIGMAQGLGEEAAWRRPAGGQGWRMDSTSLRQPYLVRTAHPAIRLGP